jgi:hypothetical protein
VNDGRIHGEMANNEALATNMKFGIVVVREFEEFVDNHFISTVNELAELGCAPQNVLVRTVPKLHDVVIATQFFAEYTDVDGVIILAPENRVMGMLSLMNGVVQIQIQWNMVVAIGGRETASNIVEMIAMQNDMELNAPENVAAPRIS